MRVGNRGRTKIMH